jgi:hypothetical protein
LVAHEPGEYHEEDEETLDVVESGEDGEEKQHVFRGGRNEFGNTDAPQ